MFHAIVVLNSSFFFSYFLKFLLTCCLLNWERLFTRDVRGEDTHTHTEADTGDAEVAELKRSRVSLTLTNFIENGKNLIPIDFFWEEQKTSIEWSRKSKSVNWNTNITFACPPPFLPPSIFALVSVNSYSSFIKQHTHTHTQEAFLFLAQNRNWPVDVNGVKHWDEGRIIDAREFRDKFYIIKMEPFLLLRRQIPKCIYTIYKIIIFKYLNLLDSNVV
jgi:hypothetical protein